MSWKCVGSVCCAHDDHGSICNNSCKVIGQPFPHCLKTFLGNNRIALAVDKIRTTEYLVVAIKNCKNYVISKKSKIPAVKGILNVPCL